MINWEKTKLLGTTKLMVKRPIIAKCDTCGIEHKTRILLKKNIIGDQYKWKCKRCRYDDPEYRKQLKERWTPQYRERASNYGKAQWTDEYKRLMSENGKAQWTDEYRQKMYEKYWSNDEYRSKLSQIQIQFKEQKSERTRQQWINDRDKLISAISEASLEKWKDQEYRELITNKIHKFYSNPEVRSAISKRNSLMYLDHEYYERMLKICRSCEQKEKIKSVWLSSDYRSKQEAYHKSTEFKSLVSSRWSDPEKRKRMLVKMTDEMRSKIAETCRKKWLDVEYRTKVLLSLKPVSSIQSILYSALDDLKVKYYREYNDKANDVECFIGPYSFDCVIPRDNKPTLLIECQGDYWHSRPKTIISDQKKASYITNNLSGQYELKYIWEHEFMQKDRVVNTLKHWLGLDELERIDFDFNNVKISECPASEYKLLLSKYHYLVNAGRGGITYGAYLDKTLIAVCVFSPLVRQNIKVDGNNPRELSRLCIHPSYQKKNFGSWFVSHCVKMLPLQYDTIISYCDTTYNHDGAIYKACNFILDGEVHPDYWYVNQDGWVMHKKTLYNHAVRNHETERSWSEKMGYKKVFGLKKYRFLLKRN